ncbi:MAG: hypothetical protein IJM91_07520 [Lachnospiraceae bacterium]|nr:hypothetical protein [Lachnospiraceae bacterium]
MNQKHFFIGHNLFSWNYGAKSSVFDQINSSNFPAAFFSIIGIMAEDCNYHIKTCYSMNNALFFDGYYNGHSSELMLRYGETDLIVARIEFAHKRSGNMTKLFKILKHIKQSYHLNSIVIESVQTDEMRAWCKKNNLTPCGNPNDSGINWEWK